jgi:hypothetical protein
MSLLDHFTTDAPGNPTQRASAFARDREALAAAHDGPPEPHQATGEIAPGWA